jgi:hypothetical protein
LYFRLRQLTSVRFLRTVIGLVGLYWRQMQHAFDVMSSENCLTRASLEELECVTELFYCLASCASCCESEGTLQDDFDLTIFTVSQSIMISVFDKCTYLLKHPVTLSHRTLAVSRDEKEIGS